MSVYVDAAIQHYGRYIMCHMLADTHAELVAMADRIEVQRRWIQKRGTPEEHFDISKGRRDKAIEAGAKQITRHELVAIIQRKRNSRG